MQVYVPAFQNSADRDVRGRFPVGRDGRAIRSGLACRHDVNWHASRLLPRRHICTDPPVSFSHTVATFQRLNLLIRTLSAYCTTRNTYVPITSHYFSTFVPINSYKFNSDCTIQ